MEEHPNEVKYPAQKDCECCHTEFNTFDFFSVVLGLQQNENDCEVDEVCFDEANQHCEDYVDDGKSV